ncbi:Uncharacterized protein dnm_055280 [Desulfonema magnum]|uniref:Uncharacterized protein n=1 Tax=Desulfonema magnum TaxID=45655 RepID=A0A975GQ34_9BACT|nr:Uncharacterized protein dnm_055280 [Desulfonema magnum]
MGETRFFTAVRGPCPEKTPGFLCSPAYSPETFRSAETASSAHLVFDNIFY